MAKHSPVIQAAWANFFLGHSLAVKAIEKELKGKAPLTLDEYDVLLAVKRSPGARTRFSSLAAATVYTKSGITRITKRLENEGLLKKESCPTDKRGAFATVSDRGEQAMKETWKYYSKAIEHVFGSCFSEREAMMLAAVLEKLCDALSPELVQIDPKSSKLLQ